MATGTLSRTPVCGGETDEERALAGYPPVSIFRSGVAEAGRTGVKMLAFEIDRDIEGQGATASLSRARTSGPFGY